MGFWDMLRGANINEGVEEWKAASGGVLIDVRSASEYRGGHIPGSINIPLQEIDRAAKKLRQKDAPLFVYCLSGARSSQAVGRLKQMGYANAKNIGGIGSYRGALE